MPNGERENEVRLREETLEHMQKLMRDAVRDGVQELMTPEMLERFWGVGLDSLQKQATQQAGRFVIGGIAGLVKKASLFIVLGGIVYAIGGWSALAALAKTVFNTGGGA